MADKNQNRIEVDLKLFQSKEIEALADFGRNIQNSIQLLQQITATFSGQVAQFADMGAGTGGGGQGGTARQSGVSNPLQSGYSSPASYSDQIANQRAGALGRVQASLRGATWAPANLNEYEKGVLHFGRPGEMTSTDLIRYGSYMSGMLGYQPQTGPNGELVNRNIPGISAAARGVSTATGAFARMSAMGAFQMPQNMASGFYGLSGASTTGNLGLQLGYGRGGIGGTGILGHGFTIGMKQKLQRVGTQWGSLGLISGEEAAAIQNELNQYGYNTSEGRGKRLYNMATGLRYRTGLDTGYIAEVLDTTQRFHPEKLKDVQKTLESMGASARQARMGLDAFAAGVAQGASQISQAMGTPTAEATKMAMQYGAATGMNPNTVGAMMTPGNMTFYMTLAKNRGSYTKTSTDVAGRMESGLQLASGIGLTKQAFLDKRQKTKVMERLNMFRMEPGLQSHYKEMFGDMDPVQVYNMMQRTGGDIRSAMTAVSTLQEKAEAGKGMSEKELKRIVNLTQSGEDRKKLLGMVGSGGKKATKRIAKEMNLMGDGAPKVQIELKGAAKKFFKFTDEATKGNHGWLAEVAVESSKNAYLGPLGQLYGAGHALMD